MPSQKRERQRQAREAKREALLAARRRKAQRRRILLAILAAVLVGGLVALNTIRDDGGTEVASGDDKTTTTTTAREAVAGRPGTQECPEADGSSERTTTFDGEFRDCLEDGKDYRATVTTDVGVVEIDLLEEEAPKTVNNFVSLARYHAYDGVPFHRVIPDFVVQGGDIEKGDGTGGPGYAIEDELPKPEEYGEGSVAMANSGPNTGGSQFFIVTSEQGAKTLVEAVGGKANYALFGTVTKGMDVVKKIEADGDPGGTPKVRHTITSVTITES